MISMAGCSKHYCCTEASKAFHGFLHTPSLPLLVYKPPNSLAATRVMIRGSQRVKPRPCPMWVSMPPAWP